MSEALLWLILLVTVVIAVLATVLRVRVSRAFQGAPVRGAVSLPAEASFGGLVVKQNYHYHLVNRPNFNPERIPVAREIVKPVPPT